MYMLPTLVSVRVVPPGSTSDATVLSAPMPVPVTV